MSVIEVVRERWRWYHVVGLVVLVVVIAGVVWYVLERRRAVALEAGDETDLVEGAA